jgi:hypothetical protein
MRPVDRNDLAYWFPRLLESGVPVPRTEVVATDCPLYILLDGQSPPGFDLFLAELSVAADRVGYPCFLRTGHASNKHAWRESCFVRGPGELTGHVVNLVEFSVCADFLGLPTATWAVREFLGLNVPFEAFNGMPVAREFRCFFRHGMPLCRHPYWPEDAILEPSRPDWREMLRTMSSLSDDEASSIDSLICRVATRFEGAWSVDVAQATDGRWVIIDMAEMDRSFHWPGCPFGAPPVAEGRFSPSMVRRIGREGVDLP